MNNSQEYCLRTQRVQDCQTILELESLLEEFGSVEGSHKSYTAEKLQFKISQLRSMMEIGSLDIVPWNLMTRTHGLRAKCMELFLYEKNEI